jgi:hypothetical protein
VGLTGDEIRAATGADIRTEKKEHIDSLYAPFPASSPLAGVGPADTHDRAALEIPLVTGGAEAFGNGVLARAKDTVLCQVAPWRLDYTRNYGLKKTFLRSSFAVNRLLANMGGAGATPLLERFATPPRADEKRWLTGFYLDIPEEWDYPYRFFRW